MTADLRRFYARVFQLKPVYDGQSNQSDLIEPIESIKTSYSFNENIAMTSETLKNRFKDWAVEIVLFTRKLPVLTEIKSVKNQIVRSAPSAAANYRAACRRKSGKDFVNKLKIVEEELDESMFWLEFIVKLAPDQRLEIIPLYKEANELLSITVASIGTARKNLNQKKN